MSKKIALIDFDTMFSRKYRTPNYDLAVTYAYLKQDKNITVRLVAIATPKDLVQYDEIFIFKSFKYLPHPSAIIKDYYKLPIKEYGIGFANRESRPWIQETMETIPDFTCYNTILRFSAERPDHPKAWKLKPQAVLKNYQHIKLYEKIGNEYLRKDIPNLRYKKLVIYDDLTTLLNTASQLEYLQEILPQINNLRFASQLDISLLNDTNILEWVIQNKKFSSLKKGLFASSLNDNVLWMVDYYIHNQCTDTNLKVLLPKEINENQYLSTLLYMNYLNNKTNYALRMRPYSDNIILKNYPLTLLAFKFLYERPFLMSFYEYLFYVGCKEMGVPVNIISTNDDTYEYITNKYGIPKILVTLEDWLRYHPEYEEYVFIGGSSNYEHIRRKTNDKTRRRIAFGECD